MPGGFPDENLEPSLQEMATILALMAAALLGHTQIVVEATLTGQPPESLRR
jgi:hypothetical protein